MALCKYGSTRSALRAIFCPRPIGRGLASRVSSEEYRDENIPSSEIYIVRPLEDNKTSLEGPIALTVALQQRKFDGKGRPLEFLKMVRAMKDASRYPICKYFDKAAERQKEVNRRKAQKANKVMEKALELNWTIGNHDLSHRMGRMEDFLRKGARVEIVIGSARKRGWMERRIDDEEAAANLVGRIRDTALSVPGTTERFDMQGQLGQMVKLTFEGKKQDMIDR